MKHLSIIEQRTGLTIVRIRQCAVKRARERYVCELIFVCTKVTPLWTLLSIELASHGMHQYLLKDGCHCRL